MGQESTPVFNPSRGVEIARCPVGSAADVDAAVRAARGALAGWAETPPGDRARILFRYKALLEEKFAEIALLICREHGKTLVEAQGICGGGWMWWTWRAGFRRC